MTETERSISLTLLVIVLALSVFMFLLPLCFLVSGAPAIVYIPIFFGVIVQFLLIAFEIDEVLRS